MRSSKRIFAPVVMAVMTLSMIGGCGLNTASDSDAAIESTESEPFSYKGPGKRDYEGPTIDQAGVFLYNSDGKVVDDFKKGYNSDLRIIKNADASEAVFIYDGTGYYVDADLNIKVIAKNCSRVGICFDGGYYFYIAEYEGVEELYIHDIENDTDYFIDEGLLGSAAISPDGRTVAYQFGSTETQVHVKGIDSQEKILESKDCDEIVTVSNDGETVFYYKMEYNRVYYCVGDGTLVKIGAKNNKPAYFDRECKQIMMQEEEGAVKYYRAGAKDPVVVMTKKYAELVAGNVPKQEFYGYGSSCILDTDSFSDAIMANAMLDSYCFYGYTPEPVEMTRDVQYHFTTYMAVTEDGPTVMYSSSNSINKISYDGNGMNDNRLCSRNGILGFVGNEDLSEVWTLDSDGIYYGSEETGTVMVVEFDENSRSKMYELRWDPTEDLCYYILDNVLYCVGSTPESNVAVMENCQCFRDYSWETDVIAVWDMENANYYIINKQPVAFY